MKKELTLDEACAKIAKVLVKRYKEYSKNKPDKVEIHIGSQINDWIVSGADGSTSHKLEFTIGNDTIRLPYQSGWRYQQTIANKIHDLVFAKIKLGKGMIKIRDEKSHWQSGYSVWSSSSEIKVLNSVTVLRVCKAFLDINKKLTKLGLKPIDPKEWWSADVSGKRAQIFNSEYYYKATHPKVCESVLAYLKGKKKLSYEFKYSEDCDEREYGIKYETEWYGHTYNDILFTDSRGQKMAF